MRVLGLADQSSLESKISIVAVRKNETLDEQPGPRETA